MLAGKSAVSPRQARNPPMSLRLYRLPEACSAPDCPDDLVAVVIDDEALTHALCERHFGAVTDPVMTLDEAGDLALVVPEQ